ncbi:MAG: Cys-tRNA(Pro) deacylase [Actinomycetota bacterium]|nr:Cys-tRNA(Pro) deacylase [Actinomycetota bacterium]
MTPAVDQLAALSVPHRILSYPHDSAAASYGTEAAEALGLDPEAVFKTLLAQLSGASDGSTLVVALVPVTGKLDLKALARAAGAKKAEMAKPEIAERTTGYVVGGISPFGQKKKLPTYVDETVELLDTVHVSAGRRGLEISLAPDDLIAVLQAAVAPIAAD